MISRRWFLLGTSAAIAAASLPNSTSVASPLDFRSRAIRDITIFPLSQSSVGESILFELKRDEGVLLSQAMTSNIILRWAAPPGGEIIQLGTQVLDMILTPDTAIAKIYITANYKMDDGPPFERVEQHSYPQVAPPVINDLYPDNSFLARVSRESARQQCALEWLTHGDDHG